MKKTFEEAWAEKEREGYQYGVDALEQVRFGWELCEAGEATQGDTRPTWPETWMVVAQTIARRSYDTRLKVGAIIVSEDNTRMLSVGYNGNAKGLPNEAESLEPGKSGFLHAELNAVIKCDYNFPKRKIMYCTHSTCRACAKVVANAGVARFVYSELYRDTSGLDVLRACGVEVMSLDEAILIG